jgi:hypothetical protein
VHNHFYDGTKESILSTKQHISGKTFDHLDQKLRFCPNITTPAMFPQNKSVHHCILCIAEQIQLMTKTTQGPVITASHISVKLKHLFVF